MAQIPLTCQEIWMLLALAAGPTGMLMEWSYASGMELCIFMEAMEAMHNRWKS